MKIEISIAVGDKIIADSYEEDDAIFRLRRFPSTIIRNMHNELVCRTHEAVEQAITELWEKNKTSRPITFPPHAGNRAYDVVGDPS